MNVVYLYTGDDGRSHFADLRIPQAGGRSGIVSSLIPVDGLIFRETTTADTGGQQVHNAPYRQFIAILRGVVDVEVGDGTKCRLNAGDVLLADDVNGEGHVTREVEGPRESLMIRFPGDFDLTQWGAPAVPQSQGP